jgi:hypothetical protein
MLKGDIFEIIVKAFGLYCIVQFIQSTPAVFGAIVVNQPEFITNKPLYIFSMLLYPLVFLLLSLIFILKSELVTKIFFSRSSSTSDRVEQPDDEKPPYGKLSFWIIIIGFFYFISSAASVLSGLPTIFIKLKEGWFFTHDPFLPQTLIFIMSLVCILKSEKIEEIINKIKRKKT